MATKNVTLLGVDYPAVPSILLPQTGGGQAEFSADVYTWLGANAETIKTLEPYIVHLDETDFPSWTPSTTSATIKARTAAYDSFEVDFRYYEYAVVWRCLADIAYSGSITGKIAQKKVGYISVSYLFKRPSTDAKVISGSYDGNAAVTIPRVMYRYQKASNADFIVFESSYGLYFGSPSVSFANTTANVTTAAINTPSLIARAYDSCMPAATFPLVDQENTVFDMRGEVLRMDRYNPTSFHSRSMIEMFRRF